MKVICRKCGFELTEIVTGLHWSPEVSRSGPHGGNCSERWAVLPGNTGSFISGIKHEPVSNTEYNVSRLLKAIDDATPAEPSV